MRCPRRVWIADRGVRPAALAIGAARAELAHQPRDALTGETQPLLKHELLVNPQRAVDALGVRVHEPDPLAELRVDDRPLAGRPAPPGVEAAPRDADRPSQQRDGNLCGLFDDEPEPAHGRSLSLMKKAAARLRISRSCRRILFSRSSSRSLARSSELSRSALLPRSALS